MKILPHHNVFELIAKKAITNKNLDEVTGQISSSELGDINRNLKSDDYEKVTREVIAETIQEIKGRNEAYRTMFFSAKRNLARRGEIEIFYHINSEGLLKINLLEDLGVYYCGVEDEKVYISNTPNPNSEKEDGQPTLRLRSNKARITDSIEIDDLLIQGVGNGEEIEICKLNNFREKTILLNYKESRYKDIARPPEPIPIKISGI